MPDKQTIKKAQRDKAKGKSASTQAGEFVKAEIDKVRKGQHGVRSAKQAIAIGLSQARAAGVKLKPYGKQKTPSGGIRRRHKNATRARASEKALKREPRNTVTRKALATQARSAASKRTAAQRSASAKKAARTRRHK